MTLGPILVALCLGAEITQAAQTQQAQQQQAKAKSQAAHAKLAVVQRQLASVQGQLQSDMSKLFALADEQDKKEAREDAGMGVMKTSFLETTQQAKDKLKQIHQVLAHVNKHMKSDMEEDPSFLEDEAHAKVAKLQKQLQESSAKMEAHLDEALNLRGAPSSLAQTGFSAVVPKGLEAASAKLHRLEEELRRQDQEYQQEAAAEQDQYPDVSRALGSSFAQTRPGTEPKPRAHAKVQELLEKNKKQELEWEAHLDEEIEDREKKFDAKLRQKPDVDVSDD